MSEQVPQKLVPGLISATKSTKPENRVAAVAFGTALAQRLDESAQGRLMAETMALPTSGKTTGPDNRIALFNIAETIPANASTSGVAVAALAPLLSKETNEVAIEALCSALTRHLSLCTVQDIKQPDDKCLASMKKDVTSVFGQATNQRPGLQRGSSLPKPFSLVSNPLSNPRLRSCQQVQ